MITKNGKNIENLLLRLNINGYTVNNILKKVFKTISGISQSEHWSGREYIDLLETINQSVEGLNNQVEILTQKIPKTILMLISSDIKLHINSELNELDSTKYSANKYIYQENMVNSVIKEVFCYFKYAKEILQDYEYRIGEILESICIKDNCNSIKQLFFKTKNDFEDNIRNIKMNITSKSIICKQKKYKLYNDEANKSLGIIIPAYNAKSTIKRTLYSIASQRILNHVPLNVYVINDFSDYDYKEIINPFKKYFNIRELNTGKNVGPGFARQYGIDNSSDDYIVFMDADDYFATPYSLQTLYNNIVEINGDLVISRFASESSGSLKIKLTNYIWMHGKIYNRIFLDKNNIRFNNTRANEDCGFNYLIKYHRPIVRYIDDITYIWSENMESITRRDNSSYDYYGLEGFSYNVAWAGNIALERGLNGYDITITTLRTMLSMWTSYSAFYNKFDIDKIIQWTKPLKKIYDKGSKYFINQSILNSEIADKIRFDKEEQIYVKPIISFEDFMKKVDL